MKKKTIRRALALVIALTLAAMPLTVYADNDPTSAGPDITPPAGSGAGPDVSAPVAASDPSSDDNNAGGGSAETSDDDSSNPAVNVIETNPKIEVNGQTLGTDIKGAYDTKTVKVVFKTSENPAKIKTTLDDSGKVENIPETTDSEDTYRVQLYEFDENKAPLAYQSLNTAAASVGASVRAYIHTDYRLKEINLNNSPKTAGLDLTQLHKTLICIHSKSNEMKTIASTLKNPQGTLPKKKLALAKVVEGGDVEILENKSDDPDLIISDITCEDASYAVIEYNE